jgi:Ran GTPase-activating protein (RanGAP) involved in mRNA processing and transport
VVFACAAAFNHQLARLDLSQNGLTATGLAALASALGASSCTLRSLDLGGNERLGCTLASDSTVEQQITSGLGAASSLRDLHLWRCGLGDMAFHVLAKAQPPHLELLNLAMNLFSPSLKDDLMRELGCGRTAAVRV